jgi:hypothetical protein
MWDDIDTAQETAKDLEWIANGMTNNSLVWTTDGSYDRKFRGSRGHFPPNYFSEHKKIKA